jgi:hypothetical protein
MHQKFAGIINIVLIMAVISMGLPHFMAGDLNHNNKADLADAIIGVADFSKTAAKLQEFVPKVKNAIIALNSVAGINQQIKAENDANSFPFLENTFLITERIYLICILNFNELFEITNHYQSANHSPDEPPPRLSLLV